MLATQIALLSALVVVLFLVRQVRWLKVSVKAAHDLIGNLQVQLAEANGRTIRVESINQVLERKYGHLNEMIQTTAAIDVGFRDIGWLILVAHVNGRPCVQIQHLKPEMSMKEYQELVKRLSYDCQHVAYIDMPRGSAYEHFLKPMNKGPRW
jgi:hypothetical protein